MLKMSLCATAFLLCSVLTGNCLSLAAVKTPRALANLEFPAGTILVVPDAIHHRTYFASSERLQQLGSQAQFILRGQHAPPESIVPSADGKLLLLRTSDDSYVLRSDSLQLVRHLSNSYAWWEGSRLRNIDRYEGYISTGRHRMRTRHGYIDLVAADFTGKYFMGMQLICKGSIKNYNTPTYRLVLLERTKGRHFHVVRMLATATFDPGSEGNPRRIEVLGKRAIVFGFPNGGADNEDYVGVLQGTRAIAPLKDSKGRRLQFQGSPLVTKNAIIGLAQAIESPHMPTGDIYIYQITQDKVTLEPCERSISFLAYDKNNDQIYIGLSARNGIALRAYKK